MSEHGSLGAVRILSRQAIQYFLVFNKGIFLFACPDKHMSVILFQPSQHSFAYCDQYWIASNSSYPDMKLHIGSDECVCITKRFPLPFDDLPQLGDIIFPCLLCNLANNTTFEENSRALQIFQRVH